MRYIDCGKFLKKVVDLKTHQRDDEENKLLMGKLPDEVELLVKNENKNTAEAAIGYKWAGMTKEKCLKVNLPSYMRRLHIGENVTNWTCRRINHQNSKINVCVGKQFIFKSHCFQSYQWSCYNFYFSNPQE